MNFQIFIGFMLNDNLTNLFYFICLKYLIDGIRVLKAGWHATWFSDPTHDYYCDSIAVFLSNLRRLHTEYLLFNKLGRPHSSLQLLINSCGTSNQFHPVTKFDPN